MKKTLKEIFELYHIYNDKGQSFPLLETELGKELFGEVNEFNKSDVVKSVYENDVFLSREVKSVWIDGKEIYNKSI